MRKSAPATNNQQQLEKIRGGPTGLPRIYMNAVYLFLVCMVDLLEYFGYMLHMNQHLDIMNDHHSY